MVRVYDMKQKEVINIKDGSRFGFICDIEIDEHCGAVVSIIVPGPGRVFGLFARDQEYKIPWGNICQFGDDIILVDVDARHALRECDE
ncbi:MAG: YlmC/YmxH family sporulation protein [Clostridiales bacterium]|jgi:YlmC/YmxH family sporulation protein|nr:YlmC/YmxH family sporulation protein [Clostridiales bacterium]